MMTEVIDLTGSF